MIVKNPEMYRKSEYPDTRVASLGLFSIYYKIEKDSITVTAFWDNRQDPKKLLQLLKKIIDNNSRFSIADIVMLR